MKTKRYILHKYHTNTRTKIHTKGVVRERDVVELIDSVNFVKFDDFVNLIDFVDFVDLSISTFSQILVKRGSRGAVGQWQK